ncbi:MAG: PASTA domain-containing protein [Bacteroidaceae bacterium]|nr:PASTA domain-containing protein [Bacteroidaceae bacterium]MBR1787915.1 PASTA domain-containing protein [Bacteroidaceae bacterium]
MDWKKKLLSPVVWGNLLAMFAVIVLLIVCTWMWLGHYTHHGEEIEVPNVVGQLVGDAEYTLEMLELEAVVVDSTYDRSKPSGTIMVQHPKAGAKVKSGREIYLTINSKQSPSIALPDIADNSSLREAQDRLRQLGFRIGPIEYRNGDKDWVYGVKCQGRTVMTGERIPTDAPITLIVGSGQDEEEIFDYDDEEASDEEGEGGQVKDEE